MESRNVFSRRLFRSIIIFALTAAAVSSTAVYQLFSRLMIMFPADAGENVLLKNLQAFMSALQLSLDNFFIWVLPAFFAICLITGIILWAVLKRMAADLFSDEKADYGGSDSKTRAGKDFVDQKIEQERKRRLFLHSLSVLQREGKLLDFFDEDLSRYDDEQIGAAVRSVQEDCKKAVKKYILLKPVIDSDEGEIVRVDPGFDTDSIKLVGNVAGEPPFEGILKHRGWKAGKTDVPKLSDIKDSTVITPAEVEIQ